MSYAFFSVIKTYMNKSFIHNSQSTRFQVYDYNFSMSITLVVKG